MLHFTSKEVAIFTMAQSMWGLVSIYWRDFARSYR